MTIGVGTDIVEVDRVSRLIYEGQERFLKRWFSEEEIRYCQAKARPELHFAARLAAKEAVFKALRSQWVGPVPWRDIEVGHNDEGAPVAVLRGTVLDKAQTAGVVALHLSISHCNSFATATVVAEGP